MEVRSFQNKREKNDDEKAKLVEIGREEDKKKKKSKAK